MRHVNLGLAGRSLLIDSILLSKMIVKLFLIWTLSLCLAVSALDIDESSGGGSRDSVNQALGNSKVEIRKTNADDDTPFGSHQKSVSKLVSDRQAGETNNADSVIADDFDSSLMQSKEHSSKEDTELTPNNIFSSHKSEKYVREPTSARDAFWLSFILIFIAEIGDKTFMMSAVLAMRNSRLQIFCASLSALGLMTLLSAFMGYALPNLLSKTVTKGIAAILFIAFALKALQEAMNMHKDFAKDELEEVEKDLRLQEAETDDAKLEAGMRGEPFFNSDQSPSHVNHRKPEFKKKPASKSRLSKESLYNLATLLLSPVSVQCFMMVFLAEWGDRSQISTVALAGSHGLVLVSLGAILGHAVCTAMAVLGGQMLAARISLKTITYFSAALFLLFGIISAVECYDNYTLTSSS